MSALEKKLDDLIAQQDRVRPEDVTLEYIRKKRDQAPNIDFEFSTNYGGYHRKGARVFTQRQALEMVRSAYQFLHRFSHPK
jgi:hypothetical protein